MKNDDDLLDPGPPTKFKGRIIKDRATFMSEIMSEYGDNPITSFYRYVSKAFNIPYNEIDVSSICLGRADIRTFDTALLKYIKTQSTEQLVERTYELTNLQYGPVFVEGLEDGFVYLMPRRR